MEQLQHLPHDASGLGGAGKSYSLRREGAAVRLHDQLRLLVFIFVSSEVLLKGKRAGKVVLLLDKGKKYSKKGKIEVVML